MNSGSITNPALGPTLQGFLGSPGAFFGALIPKAVAVAFVVGSLIFFAMLLMGAIQWISSGGDKQALEGARGRITSALIGLVLLFATYGVIKLIEVFFHISILSLQLGPLKL